ncbi:MAG: hypothetical protein KAS75_07015 [Planctomycetes bacterium]|nr:hypothetical protein [Planctomycetota bacterium]
MDKTRGKAYTLNELLVTVLIIVLIIWVAPMFVSKLKSRIPLAVCQKNMKSIGVAMHKYAADNNGMYPTPTKWCDLLVEKLDMNKRMFTCMSVGDTLRTTGIPVNKTEYPVEVKLLDDYNDESGHKKYIYEIKWSHYGLNPNAEPNSAPDVVLLFETSNGWNQYGGPDLVSVKNHLKIYRKEGCNILFNDGSVKFIKPKDVEKLKWKD